MKTVSHQVHYPLVPLDGALTDDVNSGITIKVKKGIQSKVMMGLTDAREHIVSMSPHFTYNDQ